MGKSSKKRAGLALPARPVSSSFVRAHLQTVGTKHSLSLPANTFPQSDRVLAADCARAILFHGTPELQFAALDRFTDAIDRFVVVRMPREAFVARARANGAFRKQVESTTAREVPAGYYVALLGKVGQGTPPTATLDAHADVIWISQHEGIMSFLYLPPRAVVSAHASGGPRDVDLECILEVRLPAAALADLLASWESLAEQLEPT